MYIAEVLNNIGGVMVRFLASYVVDCGFEPWSGQIEDYKIGICCFSAKHAALRRKSNDWLPQNLDNASECGNMSILRLLFQWANTKQIQHYIAYWSSTKQTSSSSHWKLTCFYHDIAELALNNNHSLTHWSMTKDCANNNIKRLLMEKLLWSISLNSFVIPGRVYCHEFASHQNWNTENKFQFYNTCICQVIFNF